MAKYGYCRGKCDHWESMVITEVSVAIGRISMVMVEVRVAIGRISMVMVEVRVAIGKVYSL